MLGIYYEKKVDLVKRNCHKIVTQNTNKAKTIDFLREQKMK